MDLTKKLSPVQIRHYLHDETFDRSHWEWTSGCFECENVGEESFNNDLNNHAPNLSKLPYGDNHTKSGYVVLDQNSQGASTECPMSLIPAITSHNIPNSDSLN